MNYEYEYEFASYKVNEYEYEYEYALSILTALQTGQTSISKYLQCQVPFQAICVKFKLRKGVCGIGEDLYCQDRGSGLCQYIYSDFESMKHFILYCNDYASLSQVMFNSIRESYGVNVLNCSCKITTTPYHTFLGIMNFHL